MKFFGIKKIFQRLLKLYSSSCGYFYKIEDIDVTTNKIIVSCKGKGATLHTTIPSIACDNYIINYLPPHHACWIGYYYGRYWYSNRNDIKCKIIELSESQFYTKYQIVSLNRNNLITYVNTKTKETFRKTPTDLAQDKLIIEFDSEQTFYIGFLAGISAEKTLDKQPTENQNTKPTLRLVK